VRKKKKKLSKKAKRANSERYFKLLETPEWKERRREILERDNYTCQKCGQQGNGKHDPHCKLDPPTGALNPLHVHHIRYNGLPWEAADEDMITLCRNCHMEEHGRI
jgi:5-methylcytosine-specific restriction endonuclease McrA